MAVRAVIFDKDGTVLDFEGFWIPIAVKATDIILSKLGVSDVSAELLLESMGVSEGRASINGSLCFGTYHDMAEDMNSVFKKYGYDFDTDMLTELTVEAYHTSTDAGEIKPTCEDMAETLALLKERGIMLVLVTSDGPVMTEKCLLGLGIREYFDLVITDDGTHPNKPDPFVINKLCVDYGFQKDEVVMVGDTLTDMKFAENGGIRGIGLSKTIENKVILFSKTDTVLYDLSWLPTVI